MILNNDELKEKYPSDIEIKNLVNEEKLFKIDKYLYSTDKNYDNLDYVLKKYNNFIFTMKTALAIYGFKNIFLKKYDIATKSKARVIKNNLIKQYFMPDELYDVGLSNIEYKGYKIKI